MEFVKQLEETPDFALQVLRVRGESNTEFLGYYILNKNTQVYEWDGFSSGINTLHWARKVMQGLQSETYGSDVPLPNTPPSGDTYGVGFVH